MIETISQMQPHSTQVRSFAVKSAGISKSKAGQGKKGKFVVEDAPDDDDHYNDRIPIMAGAMPADGETVLIKVENTELTRSPDGTLIIRKSPTKAKPKRLSAAGASSSKRSLFTGPAASKPKKPAAKPPSRGKSSSTKSRASTPPASLSSRPRRAARHGSGFYNEEYQKKLKWVKGGGTTKNPYLID
jgi:hypothetical protein